jgi:hypothetical protein
LAFAVISSGCVIPVTAQKRVQFSGPLLETHDVRCPEREIEVDKKKNVGFSTVYVLDACGAKVELEHGLEIPESFSSINQLSSEEIADLRQSLRQSPVTALQTVKRKVVAWCTEGDALLAGESEAQCESRLAAALVPIGSDSLPDGEMEYWFQLGDRAFVAKAGWQRPACENLSLTDTPEACRCRGAAGCAELDDQRTAAVTRSAAPEKIEKEGARASWPVLYARAELGFGYLQANLEGRETYRSGGFGASTFVGVALPYVVIAAGLTSQLNLERQLYSREQTCDSVCPPETGYLTVNVYGAWLRSSLYPVPAFGLHLDAALGVAFGYQRFDYHSADTHAGAAYSLGAGWESMPDERWIFGFGGRHTRYIAAAFSGSNTEGFMTFGMRAE